MISRSDFAGRLRGILSSERGIALPAAVMMLFIVTSLGLVAATQATTSSGQSTRDRAVKRAIASADAGLDVAVYRLNKLNPLPVACVVVEISTRRLAITAGGSDGWCPPQTEELGDGARYTYWVSTAETVQINGVSTFQRKIVSRGEAGGVVRRVKAVVGATTGSPLLGDYAIIAKSGELGVELRNSSRIDGKVGSNGEVSMTHSTATVCGDIYAQEHPTMGQRCPPQNDDDFPAEPPFVLSAVDQPDPDTSNNVHFAGLPGWQPATRRLTMSGIDSVTLTGNVYSLCYLKLAGNAEITIAPRLPAQGPVKIYLDRPENCTGDDKGSVDIGGSSKITNLNVDPASFVLFQVGSPSQTTSARFETNYLLTTPWFGMIVYSPHSAVSLAGESSIRGAIGAKTVTLSNTARLQWDPLVGALAIDNLIPLYQRQSWVECRSEPLGSEPDSDCS